MSLFTKLYPNFYNCNGEKNIPADLLHLCNLPHFLAILYMDDGTLSITKRINHNNKKIYLTPHVALYLQCFSKEQIELIIDHILKFFNFKFSISKRNDGYGNILRFTSTTQTYQFLEFIKKACESCPSMYYKTNWDWRFNLEVSKFEKLLPGYQVVSTNANRKRNYSNEEIERIVSLKQKGWTDKEIANEVVNRTYWSIVYKLSEVRKDGLL